jgi:hypothetical protein
MTNGSPLGRKHFFDEMLTERVIDPAASKVRCFLIRDPKQRKLILT